MLSANAEPEFSAERGLYESPLSLEITPTDGGAIRYSLDGSIPSMVLSGPLSITTTATVSAVEVAEDGSVSDTITHTFLFPADVVRDPVMDAGVVADVVYGPIIEQTLWELPSISLVASEALSTTEQEVSLEWIDPEGEELQVRCGARDVGNHSLSYDKNNIRLSFRGDYGTPSLSLDLFADFGVGIAPADEHDALTLRSGSHDSVFYLVKSSNTALTAADPATLLTLGELQPDAVFHLEKVLQEVFLLYRTP